MPTGTGVRDFNDMLNQPWAGKIFPELFNDTEDAGDGFPGLQAALHTWTKDYLHSGALESGVNFGGYDIVDVTTGNIDMIPNTNVYGIIRPREDNTIPFVSGTHDGELYWDKNDEALYRWEDDILAWIQIGS